MMQRNQGGEDAVRSMRMDGGLKHPDALLFEGPASGVWVRIKIIYDIVSKLIDIYYIGDRFSEPVGLAKGWMEQTPTMI